MPEKLQQGVYYPLPLLLACLWTWIAQQYTMIVFSNHTSTLEIHMGLITIVSQAQLQEKHGCLK